MRKLDNNVIISSLKSKMINRIPGLHLLISSLPGSAMRKHVESLSKPFSSTSVLAALPGKLDIKILSPSFLCILTTHAPIGVHSVLYGLINLYQLLLSFPVIMSRDI